MEWFWCPPNVKWSDYPPDSAKVGDLYYSLITAGVLIGTRMGLEKCIFSPIGRSLCQRKCSCGGDTKNRRSSKPSVVKKFSEGMWRLTFYFAASIYGWRVVLWDKPHLTDPLQSLIDYPNHPVTTEEWWYYNIELGFYVSLVITQVIDTKRKDFWQMFVHHIVTIALLVLSWSCNFHRMGCMVLAIHDIADVPMEGAKLAKYCNRQRLADLLFAIFTVTWIYTRCYVLPTRVIYYTSYKALDFIPIFPAYYVFNGLLCLLQLLHICWTVLIVRIIFDALKNDGMRDLRSESEDSDEHQHTD